MCTLFSGGFFTWTNAKLICTVKNHASSAGILA